MHDFACVLDAVALDRGSIISVLARGYADSGVVGGYAATLAPAFRQSAWLESSKAANSPRSKFSRTGRRVRKREGSASRI